MSEPTTDERTKPEYLLERNHRALLIRQNEWAKWIQIGLYVFMVIYWGAMLNRTDSYMSPYIIILLLSVFCFMKQKGSKADAINRKGIPQCRLIVYGFFSLCVTAANYSLFSFSILTIQSAKAAALVKGIVILLFFISGCHIFRPILLFIEQKAEITERTVIRKEAVKNRTENKHLFFASMLIIAGLYLVVFFLTAYPGVLNPDSMSQIDQICSGIYSNHHPYYHTLFIKLFFELGLSVFHSTNAAVATYAVVQILIFSAVFSLAVITIRQLTGSNRITFAVFVYFLLMPVHIMYSFNLWKDSLYGVIVLLFSVQFIRAAEELSRKGIQRTLDIVLLALSGFGVCLFRSNGWFVFLLSTAVFFVLYRKKKLRYIKVLFLVLLSFTFILKHPVLTALDVRQPDTVESLSVPVQQLARVIVENDDLTPEQRELLSHVVEIEKIKERYKVYISDPVKDLVRENKNYEEYLKSHRKDFIKLYLRVGVNHPGDYIKAWIDQTRGYWNAGYPYWKWTDMLYDNQHDIFRVVVSAPAVVIRNLYLSMFEFLPPLQLLISIGFTFWIIVLLIYYGFIRKNRPAVFLGMIHCFVVLSLMIATPVFAEFRYSYPLFCCVPLLIVITLWPVRCPGQDAAGDNAEAAKGR